VGREAKGGSVWGEAPALEARTTYARDPDSQESVSLLSLLAP
jgi:hypothetical protein